MFYDNLTTEEVNQINAMVKTLETMDDEAGIKADRNRFEANLEKAKNIVRHRLGGFVAERAVSKSVDVSAMLTEILANQVKILALLESGAAPAVSNEPVLKVKPQTMFYPQFNRVMKDPIEQVLSEQIATELGEK